MTTQTSQIKSWGTHIPYSGEKRLLYYNIITELLADAHLSFSCVYEVSSTILLSITNTARSSIIVKICGQDGTITIGKQHIILPICDPDPQHFQRIIDTINDELQKVIGYLGSSY